MLTFLTQFDSQSNEKWYQISYGVSECGKLNLTPEDSGKINRKEIIQMHKAEQMAHGPNRHWTKSNLLDGKKKFKKKKKQNENASFILKIILFQNKLDNISTNYHPTSSSKQQNGKGKKDKSEQFY